MIIVLDFETTGFPNPKLPARDPKQAHVCEIGVIVCNDKLQPIHRASYLFRLPLGVEMSAGAEVVHGHSKDFLQAHGRESPPFGYFSMLIDTTTSIAGDLKMIVAHNVPFEKRMLQLSRLQFLNCEVPDPEWLSDKWFCTMQAMKSAVSALTAKGTPKNPKLAEAYFRVTGRPPSDQHHALADAESCLTIVRWLFDSNPLVLKEIINGSITPAEACAAFEAAKTWPDDRAVVVKQSQQGAVQERSSDNSGIRRSGQVDDGAGKNGANHERKVHGDGVGSDISEVWNGEQ